MRPRLVKGLNTASFWQRHRRVGQRIKIGHDIGARVSAADSGESHRRAWHILPGRLQEAVELHCLPLLAGLGFHCRLGFRPTDQRSRDEILRSLEEMHPSVPDRSYWYAQALIGYDVSRHGEFWSEEAAITVANTLVYTPLVECLMGRAMRRAMSESPE